MRVLPRAGFAQKPWKNGGGVSWDALAHPGGEWLLTLSEIARDGAFSDYAGWDRTLTPVEGAGLELNGRTLDGTPFPFDGALPVSARVPAGRVLVFNVLSLRAAWRHAVRRTTLDAPRDVTADFVVPVGGAVTLGESRAGHLDLACTGGATLRAVPDGRAELLEVTLRPA